MPERRCPPAGDGHRRKQPARILPHLPTPQGGDTRPGGWWLSFHPATLHSSLLGELDVGKQEARRMAQGCRRRSAVVRGSAGSEFKSFGRAHAFLLRRNPLTGSVKGYEIDPNEVGLPGGIVSSTKTEPSRHLVPTTKQNWHSRTPLPDNLVAGMDLPLGVFWLFRAAAPLSLHGRRGGCVESCREALANRASVSVESELPNKARMACRHRSRLRQPRWLVIVSTETGERQVFEATKQRPRPSAQHNKFGVPDKRAAFFSLPSTTQFCLAL